MLMREVAEDGEMKIAAATVAKCTQGCLMSLKEGKLLQTEEACMINCYNKAFDFNANYSERFAYSYRHLEEARRTQNQNF